MKKIANIAVSIAIAMLTAAPVFAGFSDGCSVTLGNKPAFRILGSAYGFTPEHRAWLAQDALDNALVLASDLSPASVTTDVVNNANVVLLDGYVVATADAESARLENTTPAQLAANWADSIRSFLADQSQTDQYIASLTGKNPVEASVVVAERKLYAPAGLAFSVRLSKNISASDLKEGEIVEAVIDKDVVLGHYAIPANSIVEGELVATGNNNYNLCFTTLRTPSGTEVPIKAIATSDYVISMEGPHTLSTYAIPSGSAIGVPDVVGRIPARVGIGIPDAKQYLVIHGGATALVANQPLTLMFEDTTPVAVIQRDMAM